MRDRLLTASEQPYASERPSAAIAANRSVIHQVNEPLGRVLPGVHFCPTAV